MTVFRLLYLPLVASLVAAQSLPYRHATLRQQTADSVTVVASWTAQHADSVRIAYGNGITRTRGPRGRDSVRVARPNSAANFGLTLTPLRGSVAGAARVLSVALPVRPQPAPSIDSASVDTATTAPVVPPPPPSPPTAFTPNLPAGLTRYVDTRFTTQVPYNAYNSDSLGYVWDGRNAIDPTAPWGPNVFETFYAGNIVSNGDGGAMLFSPQGQQWSRFYFAVSMWVPANYSVHTNEEKFIVPLVNTGGRITGYRLAWWPNPNADSPTITWKIMPRPGWGETIDNPAVAIPKGRWTTIEVYMQMNTGSAANGVLRIWVDGRVSVDRANITFSDGPDTGTFEGIRFDGTRGGGSSTVPTPAGGQVRRYNRLAVYYGRN